MAFLKANPVLIPLVGIVGAGVSPLPFPSGDVS